MLGTFDTLAMAMTAFMVPGEDPQELTGESISLGCSRTTHEDIGKKALKLGDSEVTIPQNLTVFGNKSLDIKVSYFELVREVLHVKFYIRKIHYPGI